MSDKPVRSIPEIQQEYQSLCTKAGHLNYQVYTLSKDLELVNSQLRDLNFEAASIQANAPKVEEPANEQKEAQ